VELSGVMDCFDVAVLASDWLRVARPLKPVAASGRMRPRLNVHQFNIMIRKAMKLFPIRSWRVRSVWPFFCPQPVKARRRLPTTPDR